MIEVWLPIPQTEGVYVASNLGRIQRVGGAILAPVETTGGYRVVTLSLEGRSSNRRISRLVLEAFCGPPPFAGAHAAHNDGDVRNNALTNLRWATPVENQRDVDRHGHRCRGESVHGARLSEGKVREIRRRCGSESNQALAASFGVSVSTIHLIRHNRTWRHVA